MSAQSFAPIQLGFGYTLTGIGGVLGVIDCNRGDVSLDATLYDSRILQFVLTGDMALRANWGTQPNFVLSLGASMPTSLPRRASRNSHVSRSVWRTLTLPACALKPPLR
jgi:uncharacterized protein DUF6603